MDTDMQSGQDSGQVVAASHKQQIGGFVKGFLSRLWLLDRRTH